MPDQEDVASRLQLACRIAREAGDRTLEYFRQDGLEVQRKSDQTPVTEADRQGELLLRSRIEASFAEDGIRGEEFPVRPGTSGYEWILDPIDGTKSFVHGVPLYGTLVGVTAADSDVASLGVIYLPALGEMVYAARGQSAWYVEGDGEPRPARVSDCGKLSDALFCTSEIASYGDPQREAAYGQLQAAARITRTWGDCYGYLLVATGRADLMIDPVVSDWDVAAIQPVIEEAGGVFSDWKGRRTFRRGEAIATNRRLIDEVLTITADA